MDDFIDFRGHGLSKYYQGYPRIKCKYGMDVEEFSNANASCSCNLDWNDPSWAYTKY